MEIIQIIETVFTVMGGAITILAIIAPLTKAKWDDRILLALKGISNSVKLNKKDKTILLQLPENRQS